MGPRHGDDDVTMGALALAGLMQLAAAVLAGRLALEHMELAEAICGGGGVGHCVWCAVATALAISGLGALGLAVRPRARPARRRSPQQEVAMHGGGASLRRSAGSAAARARI